jgi:hypothetical protein
MRMRRLAIALVTAVLATCAVSGRSHAQLIELPDLFPDTGTYGLVAFYPSLGSNAVYFLNFDTGGCRGYLMTNTEADYLIRGEGGNDTLYVTDGSGEFCGMAFQPPQRHNGAIDMAGEEGNDHVSSTFRDSFLYGGPGSDALEATSATSHLVGGSGDDSLYLKAVADNAEMDGDGDRGGSDGNDCLQNQGGTFRILDCGLGYDLYSGPGPRPPTCEETIAACCPGVVC